MSRLPVEECLLSEQEVDALQAELEAEKAEDDLKILMELAAELTLLESAESEHADLRKDLVQVVDRVLAGQPLGRVATMIDTWIGWPAKTSATRCRSKTPSTRWSSSA